MLDVETIKHYAYTLGFDSARITTAASFPAAETVIQERIEKGWFDGLNWFTAERAAVSCHPDALLPEATSIIALAMCYLTAPPEETDEQRPHGRISRYAWGDDYHDIIKPKLQQFAAWLKTYALETLGETIETRLFVDTGRMVDRAVAERSGIGWYGKNTNILTRGWGSWVFLAEIVTNLPLPPDQPLKAHCGKCEICLHACPTGALPQPYALDSTRCISYLTIEHRGTIPLELRPLMGNLIYGCDICQDVCPVNHVAEQRLGVASVIPLENIHKRAQQTTEQQPSFQGKTFFQKRPQVGSNPDLIALLSLTDDQFRERFRRSPIKRAKRRGLLRNVCIALGNAGDPQAIPALTQALHDEEALIRGHAAWALGTIGGEQSRKILLEAQGIERDTEVQIEIRYALTLIKSS